MHDTSTRLDAEPRLADDQLIATLDPTQCPPAGPPPTSAWEKSRSALAGLIGTAFGVMTFLPIVFDSGPPSWQLPPTLGEDSVVIGKLDPLEGADDGAQEARAVSEEPSELSPPNPLPDVPEPVQSESPSPPSSASRRDDVVATVDPLGDTGTPAGIGESGSVHEGTWVVIHYSSESGRLRADRIRNELDGAAFDSVRVRKVDVQVDQDDIRYFYDEDRARADEVRALASSDQPKRVRDFSHYTPRPTRGLVEIWLQG